MENLELTQNEHTIPNGVVGNPQELLNLDLAYISECLQKEFMAMAGKKLLITGGAGFLGYYLVHAIVYWNKSHPKSEKIQLTVYDNFSRGVPNWIGKLAEQKALTLKVHDIRRPLRKTSPNFAYIIHAASIASPPFYRMHPIETMDANVNGLRNLLEYARGRQETGNAVEGMLFFSSSEIYGDPTPEDIPTPETYHGFVSCTGPRSCYDESKRYGETLCVNFSRKYNIPIKVARPFNNYGPGLKMTDGRVLPDFAQNVLRDQDIILLSDGTPKRTFCYIADAVVGYYKVLVTGRKGEAYNIGVQEPEISMRELAEHVASLGRELFAYSGSVIHKSSSEESYLTDNPQRRCPVISKAREELSYNPSITLKDGLRRTLLWYHDHPDGRECK